VQAIGLLFVNNIDQGRRNLTRPRGNSKGRIALKNRLVSAAIAGPRTEAQWDSYREALKLQLGPDDERFVDGLVPPGHASTLGYTDPGYPVEGRQTA
jgi:hypothetical protein